MKVHVLPRLFAQPAKHGRTPCSVGLVQDGGVEEVEQPRDASQLLKLHAALGTRGQVSREGAAVPIRQGPQDIRGQQDVRILSSGAHRATSVAVGSAVSGVWNARLGALSCVVRVG